MYPPYSTFARVNVPYIYNIVELFSPCVCIWAWSFHVPKRRMLTAESSWHQCGGNVHGPQMGQGVYMDKLRTMFKTTKKRLLVDLTDLRNFDRDLTRRYSLLVITTTYLEKGWGIFERMNALVVFWRLVVPIAIVQTTFQHFIWEKCCFPRS